MPRRQLKLLTAVLVLFLVGYTALPTLSSRLIVLMGYHYHSHQDKHHATPGNTRDVPLQAVTSAVLSDVRGSAQNDGGRDNERMATSREESSLRNPFLWTRPDGVTGWRSDSSSYEDSTTTVEEEEEESTSITYQDLTQDYSDNPVNSLSSTQEPMVKDSPPKVFNRRDNYINQRNTQDYARGNVKSLNSKGAVVANINQGVYRNGDDSVNEGNVKHQSDFNQHVINKYTRSDSVNQNTEYLQPVQVTARKVNTTLPKVRTASSDPYPEGRSRQGGIQINGVAAGHVYPAQKGSPAAQSIGEHHQVLTPLSIPREGQTDWRDSQQPAGEVHEVHSLPPPPTPRYLVYLCDAGEERCGGWADRQRGMLSVFLLAKVTNRIFKVDMRTPCNVTNFIHPTGEDWWSRGDNSADSSMTVVNDMRGRSVLAPLLQGDVDFNVKFPHTVVYVQTTRDLAPLLNRSNRYSPLLPDWARYASQAIRFRLSWQLLAAPTASITKRLDKLLLPLFRYPDPKSHRNLVEEGTNSRLTQAEPDTNSVHHVPTNDLDTVWEMNMIQTANRNTKTLNNSVRQTTPKETLLQSSNNQTDDKHKHHKLLCAHLRMGRNPTLPDDTSIRNDAGGVEITFTFLQHLMRGENSYVFIATDDQGVRMAARRTFGVRLLDHGGTIVHIDRPGTILHACAGFETAILDQLVLSQCDVLVMSRSGFSRHAAYLRHQELGLYLLDKGVIAPHSLNITSDKFE